MLFKGGSRKEELRALANWVEPYAATHDLLLMFFLAAISLVAGVATEHIQECDLLCCARRHHLGKLGGLWSAS